MKYYSFFIIGIVLVFLSVGAFGQSVGLYFSPTQYNQDKGITYNNIENRLTTDFGIYYKIPLTSNLNFQFGYAKTKRISEIDYGFSNAKVFEDFVNLPILVEMSKNVTDKTVFVVGLGPNVATVFKQKLLFPDNIQLPTDFKTEYNYASYWKFGFIANIGFIHNLTPQTSFFVSASSQYEFEDLSINKDNNPAFFYRTFSINLGLQISLKKK